MIHEIVAIDDVVKLLNEVVKLDAKAAALLVESRVPCNNALTDHPTIQVSSSRDGEEPNLVGVLGIINGIFGVDSIGWGAIQAHFEDDGTLTEFSRRELK